MRLTTLIALFALILCNARAADAPQKTQRVGPLEITAADSVFRDWRYQDPSLRFYGSVTGWGVAVRITNVTDKEISQFVGPEGVQMTNASGKQSKLEGSSSNFWPLICREQLSAQDLDGSELALFNSGVEVTIKDATTTVGKIGGIAIEGKWRFTLLLAPKKSITLVYIFDSPKESKPISLTWPEAKPIDLR